MAQKLKRYRLIYIPTSGVAKFKAHLVGAHTQRGHQQSAEIEVSAANHADAFATLQAVIRPGDPRPLGGRSFVAKGVVPEVSCAAGKA